MASVALWRFSQIGSVASVSLWLILFVAAWAKGPAGCYDHVLSSPLDKLAEE